MNFGVIAFLSSASPDRGEKTQLRARPDRRSFRSNSFPSGSVSATVSWSGLSSMVVCSRVAPRDTSRAASALTRSRLVLSDASPAVSSEPVDPQDRSPHRDHGSDMADAFQRRGLIEAAHHGLEGAVCADDNDLTGVRSGRRTLILGFSGIGSRSPVALQ